MLRGRLSADGNDPERLAVLVRIGVLGNAFVCGAMSVPLARFQLRVVWLIPLAAALIYRNNSRYAELAQREIGRSDGN
jgi:hypothetical protein